MDGWVDGWMCSRTLDMHAAQTSSDVEQALGKSLPLQVSKQNPQHHPMAGPCPDTKFMVTASHTTHF